MPNDRNITKPTGVRLLEYSIKLLLAKEKKIKELKSIAIMIGFLRLQQQSNIATR